MFMRKLSFFKNTKRTSSSSKCSSNRRLPGSNKCAKFSNTNSKMEISAQTKRQGHPPIHSKYKFNHNKLLLEKPHKLKMAKIQISKARKILTPLLLVAKSEKMSLKMQQRTEPRRLIDELGENRPTRLNCKVGTPRKKKPAARVSKSRRVKTIRATILLTNKLVVPKCEKESPSLARTNKLTKLGQRDKLAKTRHRASRKKEATKMLQLSKMDRKRWVPVLFRHKALLSIQLAKQTAKNLRVRILEQIQAKPSASATRRQPQRRKLDAVQRVLLTRVLNPNQTKRSDYMMIFLKKSSLTYYSALLIHSNRD